MRATSKRLCLSASIARSNSTLSGCLEPTLASGFWTFLLVQAAVRASSSPNSRTTVLRHNIKTPEELVVFAVFTCPRGSAELSLHFQQRGLYRSFQQFLRVTLWIAVTEYSAACHQDFRPGPYHIAHGIQGNTPIDLDPIIQALRLAHLRQPANLVHRAGNELLSAKAWIHRHHQHVIHNVENLSQRFHRGGRVDDYTRLCAVVFNVMQGAVQVYACLLMHRNPVRSGLYKIRDVLVGILDHQVTVKRQIGDLA